MSFGGGAPSTASESYSEEVATRRTPRLRGGVAGAGERVVVEGDGAQRKHVALSELEVGQRDRHREFAAPGAPPAAALQGVAAEGDVPFVLAHRHDRLEEGAAEPDVVAHPGLQRDVAADDPDGGVPPGEEELDRGRLVRPRRDHHEPPVLPVPQLQCHGRVRQGEPGLPAVASVRDCFQGRLAEQDLDPAGDPQAVKIDRASGQPGDRGRVVELLAFEPARPGVVRRGDGPAEDFQAVWHLHFGGRRAPDRPDRGRPPVRGHDGEGGARQEEDQPGGDERPERRAPHEGSGIGLCDGRGQALAEAVAVAGVDCGHQRVAELRGMLLDPERDPGERPHEAAAPEEV